MYHWYFAQPTFTVFITVGWYVDTLIVILATVSVTAVSACTSLLTLVDNGINRVIWAKGGARFCVSENIFLCLWEWWLETTRPLWIMRDMSRRNENWIFGNNWKVHKNHATIGERNLSFILCNNLNCQLVESSSKDLPTIRILQK